MLLSLLKLALSISGIGNTVRRYVVVGLLVVSVLLAFSLIMAASIIGLMVAAWSMLEQQLGAPLALAIVCGAILTVMTFGYLFVIFKQRRKKRQRQVELASSGQALRSQPEILELAAAFTAGWTIGKTT